MSQSNLNFGIYSSKYDFISNTFKRFLQHNMKILQLNYEMHIQMTLHNHYKKTFTKFHTYISRPMGLFLYRNTVCGMNTNIKLLYFTHNLEDLWISSITLAILTWMIHSNSYELEQKIAATDGSGRHPWDGTAVSDHAEVTSSGNSTAQWALLFCQVQLLI